VICADIKEVTPTNWKDAAKQEDASRPLPPNSPDLGPSDFSYFGPLKAVAYPEILLGGVQQIQMRTERTGIWGR